MVEDPVVKIDGYCLPLDETMDIVRDDDIFLIDLPEPAITVKQNSQGVQCTKRMYSSRST